MTGAALEGDWEGWAALGEDLALLARLHDRELDAPLITSLRAAPVEDWFALRMSGEEFEKVSALIAHAFALAPDPLTEAALDEMAAEYAAIYLNHTYRVSACESFWVGEDGLERQEPMFSVRRCFGRFAVKAPDWRHRADDHIAYELALLAQVAPRLGDPETARAVGQFMREHPLVWVPDFAARVARRCQSPFYAGVALLTALYLKTLARLLAGAYGIDMTPVEPKTRSASTAAGPTCADPSPRYTPGPGPGW